MKGNLICEEVMVESNEDVEDAPEAQRPMLCQMVPGRPLVTNGPFFPGASPGELQRTNWREGTGLRRKRKQPVKPQLRKRDLF